MGIVAPSNDVAMTSRADRWRRLTYLWTFVRPHGGRWVLSAIQQAR